MDATLPASRTPSKTMIVTKLGALMSSVIALVPVLGWALGGGIFHWTTVFLALVVLPILDTLVGADDANIDPAREQQYLSNIWYRISVWVYLPIQLSVMFFCYWLIAYGNLATYEIIGLALSNAFALGISGLTAHELMHRDKLDRFIGVLIFSGVGMGNFLIYHNYGHHKTVATPEDPATARFGETYWHAAPRNIWGKFKASWRIEAERQRRNGRHPICLHNMMIWISLGEISFVGLLCALFGWVALPLFATQYVASRFGLSVADYLEHYGLSRHKLPSGEYEPPNRHHAWDDTFVVSSLVLCVVNRHADHHANEGRPYQILRYSKEAPRYPLGNFGMLLHVLIPPLWRKMVHPVLLKYYDEHPEVVPYAMPGALPKHLESRAVFG